MTEAAAGWAGRGTAYAASAVHRHGASLSKLVALVRPQRADRILDLGTGTGHTAALLARWSDDVTGVDPEPDMLAVARTAYGALPGLAFVAGSGERLPFATGSFDAVTARHTLHHHRDASATLAEVARVLRPGGRFVLVDETPANERHAPWFERIERTRDPSHVACRLLPTWLDLLSGAGLAWIAGDDRTRYELDMPAWLDRMDPSTEVREQIYAMFRDAPPDVREAFAIVFEGDQPVRFEMPMNIVLAIKEES